MKKNNCYAGGHAGVIIDIIEDNNELKLRA